MRISTRVRCQYQLLQVCIEEGRVDWQNVGGQLLVNNMREAVFLVGAILGVAFAIYRQFSQRQRQLTHEGGNRESENRGPSQSWTCPPPEAQNQRKQSLSNCVICLQVVTSNSRKLRCGHIFHLDCLQRWLRHQKVCPLCRKPASQ